MSRSLARILFSGLAFSVFSVSAVFASDTIRIAYVEGLTGPFAQVGEQGLFHFQMEAEEVNSRGGVLGGRKLEIVPFDHKGSAQESLLALQNVQDQNIRFMVQGNGSHIAGALSEGVAKILERTPEKAVLFMNYAAIDPTLTNEKCNFMHFRFDANTEMKLAGVTDAIAKDQKIKKVYIIGQDYAHGHQISRISKELLKKKRPDIEIVGDDLHPIGKVKDFSPYVAKIKASGAQAVITGNWGNDMTLLIKSAKESGLDVDWYTFYAGGLGTPPAIGEGGINQVHQITEYFTNLSKNDSKVTDEFIAKFAERAKQDYYYFRIKLLMEMLAKAIDKAKSDDPVKVARALEGMKHEGATGEVWMRGDDHQLHMPMYISTLTKAGPATEYKHDIQKSGLGFKLATKIPLESTVVPTSCNMKRP